MNILDAVQQTTRRAGGGHTRQRGTEAFEQATKFWSAAERPERVLRRMRQLGLKREALTLAATDADRVHLERRLSAVSASLGNTRSR